MEMIERGRGGGYLVVPEFRGDPGRFFGRIPENNCYAVIFGVGLFGVPLSLHPLLRKGRFAPLQSLARKFLTRANSSAPLRGCVLPRVRRAAGAPDSGKPLRGLGVNS